MNQTEQQIKKLQSIEIFQCGLCGAFSLNTTKQSGCVHCNEGHPFMESVGTIQLTTTPKSTISSKEGELCPLCYEPVKNGKKHGSWCKWSTIFYLNVNVDIDLLVKKSKVLVLNVMLDLRVRS